MLSARLPTLAVLVSEAETVTLQTISDRSRRLDPASGAAPQLAPDTEGLLTELALSVLQALALCIELSRASSYVQTGMYYTTLQSTSECLLSYTSSPTKQRILSALTNYQR